MKSISTEIGSAFLPAFSWVLFSDVAYQQGLELRPCASRTQPSRLALSVQQSSCLPACPRAPCNPQTSCLAEDSKATAGSPPVHSQKAAAIAESLLQLNCSEAISTMATDNKYDRQLRLWGSNGQKALMEAHILVIHAGPTGTETLKNLVLPGVGRFTILDSAMVEERDLGNNFFVTEEHLGRPRAQVTCELLLEMNPDVQGDFLVGDLSTLVADDPAFFSKFSLVIAAQTPTEPLQALASVCWTRSIPLIVCRSYGLLGYVRMQLREHSVVEAKPDSALQDLRIAAPWPELADYCAAVDLAKLDSKAHSHTPYVVLLVQAVAAWKAAHGGSPPTTFAEKTQFKEAVKAMSRDIQHQCMYTLFPARTCYAVASASIVSPSVVSSTGSRHNM
eukprot:5492-Heterococcus_DN1.PRE.2